MLKRPLLHFFILSVLCILYSNVFAQKPLWTFDLLKKDSTRPEKYKETKLGSEKMAEKNFSKAKRFQQNTFTHYNYYYNSNNKINAVIENAKIAQVDDYTKLLSFYPYSLDNTASQKTELDSVIIKATAGILIHDLRNDWIDNMYLLMGKAYFLKKDFDTAIATFQFINYNLFPRKKDEDDSRVVGTRDDAKSSAMSIANKEELNIFQKIASQPPSRNDALIWLARTLVEREEYGEAAGLINTLQGDPNLPDRLRNDLEEVNAYWFFRQGIYDSTVTHLEKSLSTAKTKQDLARTEYLLAQLYEKTKQYSKASDYYINASQHTNSPLMDIHARLSNAKMLKGTQPKELDNSINNLLSMAKKDRYEDYRDIIYFSAGQIALQKPDTNTAVTYLEKSLKYKNESNISLTNKTYLQLADIAYDRKEYKKSFICYDSLQSGDTTLDAEKLAQIMERRTALSKIVGKLDIISREDSLQRLAALTPAERDVIVKKKVKELRKAQGLKEDVEINDQGGVMGFEDTKNQPAVLFGNDANEEWYFYNSSRRAKGYREFKSKWGTRENVDNWRLSGLTKAVVTPQSGMPPTVPEMSGSFNPDEVAPADPMKPAAAKPTEVVEEQEISYDALMAKIPLSAEKMAASHALLSISIFELAQLYQNELEDYEQAIKTYDESLARYPDSLYNGDIYFGLYYCYKKLGNTAKAEYYKNLLNTKFSNSKPAQILANPAAAKAAGKDEAATKRYEDIYNLFIEGKFEQALDEKKKADSVHGSNYWTPQLLYIEAVYHIKQKEDSAATKVLDAIMQLYPSTPIASKAERLKDVLSRRAQIEQYLNDLQITRATEDQIVKIDDSQVQQQQPVVKQSEPAVTTQSPQPPAEPVAQPPVETETVIMPPPPPMPAVKDTIKKGPPPLVRTGEYSFDAGRKHNIIMIFDKVDITYVIESKNALAPYGSKNGFSNIAITRDALDADRALLIFSSFATADDALKFRDILKKVAPEEISWMPANKYSFLIIDDGNLQILKEKKNLDVYKGLLNTQYPGRF